MDQKLLVTMEPYRLYGNTYARVSTRDSMVPFTWDPHCNYNGKIKAISVVLQRIPTSLSNIVFFEDHLTLMDL